MPTIDISSDEGKRTLIAQVNELAQIRQAIKMQKAREEYLVSQLESAGLSRLVTDKWIVQFTQEQQSRLDTKLLKKDLEPSFLAPFYKNLIVKKCLVVPVNELNALN